MRGQTKYDTRPAHVFRDTARCIGVRIKRGENDVHVAAPSSGRDASSLRLATRLSATSAQNRAGIRLRRSQNRTWLFGRPRREASDW